MAVRIVINLNVKPGTGDDFAAAWAPEYDLMNAKPGCVQYELFRSTRNPDHFAVLELWTDRAAFDAHWETQSKRPRAGAELRDHPDNRKVGASGLEIYWERASYTIAGTKLTPL